VLRCARGGARPRPQCELRALERLFASPCARTRLEGEGRDPREPRASDPIGLYAVPPATRDPTRDVRPCPARRDPADLTSRALRPRRLAVRLLRIGGESAHPRPRRPEIARGHVGVGERGHVVRTVQPPEGRSAPGGDEHDAAHDTAPPDTRALHSPRGRARAGSLAALFAGSRPGCRSSVGATLVRIDVPLAGSSGCGG